MNLDEELDEFIQKRTDETELERLERIEKEMLAFMKFHSERTHELIESIKRGD